MEIGLAEVTAETFSPLIGAEFSMALNEGEAPVTQLRLSEVKVMANAPEHLPRTPFSLYFVGPAERPIAQGMFWFSHDSIGEQPIFIVPVRGDSEKHTYEAVFN